VNYVNPVTHNANANTNTNADENAQGSTWPCNVITRTSLRSRQGLPQRRTHRRTTWQGAYPTDS
jgi:hypothetical protein